MGTIIGLLIVGGIGYMIYTKMQGGKAEQSDSPDAPGAGSEPDLFNMKKGWIVDFYDNFILKGFPIEGENILENGPYEVVGINKTTSTTEYTIRGGKEDATLEVEKKGGRNVILIQTALENYPSLLPQIKKSWTADIDQFEFKGVTYFLVDDGEEEDGGEECYYWDYYSDAINEGNKLYIGIQDYGDKGKPELEFYVGFEIPDRSIKEIIPA